jgi:SNF2 family DNA or RNA helicase
LALRLDPVRLLIADDVGIGKTVEACVIAKELLDRGEVRRLAVLCPPHLAEQWQRELSEKFSIDAELVLPSTARRLEAPCRLDESLFDIHPPRSDDVDQLATEDIWRRC